MFWMDNVNELLNPVIIPNINMTIEEKINTIVRAVLFVGIICTLVLTDTRYILFIIIIMIASILIINYQYEKNSKIEKFLNSNNIDIIDNKKCIKPTESNPFMNPNILNLTDENKNLKGIILFHIFLLFSNLYFLLLFFPMHLRYSYLYYPYQYPLNILY